MKYSEIKEAVDYIKQFVKYEPQIGVILGSGLGDLAESIEDKIIIDYKNIPNMPVSTVKGHKGKFVFGKLRGKNVVMMQGRVHYYEGNPMANVTIPVYIMKYLGVKDLIVTNASGGVNESYVPGDLMIIKDHINLSGMNPLIGSNDERLGVRFPDVSRIYDLSLIKTAEDAAKSLNIKLQKGVYIMLSGPSYETPAEIRMVRVLGADAVGMSTVPEVIAAAHSGLKVLGISCITNMAAGILDKPLNHEEVMETTVRTKDKFVSLLSEIIEKIKY